MNLLSHLIHFSVHSNQKGFLPFRDFILIKLEILPHQYEEVESF